MKYLPLLWSSLWRKKVRTIFTLLSVFVAFLLFGLLMTIRTAFSFGVDIAGIDRLVQRIEQQDEALEKRLAEEPPQMTVTLDAAAAPPEPPPPPAPPVPPAPPAISLDTLLPGRGAGVQSERDVHGLLPKIPDATGIEGRPPYLSPLEPAPAPPVAATPGTARDEPATPESAARTEDYDPDVAAIFSEEATELLEAADGAVTALKTERGSRERVTELARMLSGSQVTEAVLQHAAQLLKINS